MPLISSKTLHRKEFKKVYLISYCCLVQFVQGVDSFDGLHHEIDELFEVAVLEWSFVGEDATISDLQHDLRILEQIEIASTLAARIKAIYGQKFDLLAAVELCELFDESAKVDAPRVPVRIQVDENVLIILY